MTCSGAATLVEATPSRFPPSRSLTRCCQAFLCFPSKKRLELRFYGLVSDTGGQRRKTKPQYTAVTSPSWSLPGEKMAAPASHGICGRRPGLGCPAARGRPRPTRGCGPEWLPPLRAKAEPCSLSRPRDGRAGRAPGKGSRVGAPGKANEGLMKPGFAVSFPALCERQRARRPRQTPGIGDGVGGRGRGGGGRGPGAGAGDGGGGGAGVSVERDCRAERG